MPADQPNVLLIHADEHRADCLGAYGNTEVRTPNIDALAGDGVTFKNCFTTFPVCTPARYSLLTGLYAHQHLGCTNQSTLPHGLPTFPRILQENGYHTKCVGKMHFTPTYADVGFGEMVLAEQDGPGRYDDDYHRYLMQRGLIDRTDLLDQDYEFRRNAPPEYWANFGTDPTNLEENEHSTAWIGDHACETIDQWEEGSHMLMVGFIKPHHPFDAPPPWSEMYDPEILTLLPGWTEKCLPLDLAFRKGHFDYTALTFQNMQVILAKYYAAISQIDAYVGKMVAILKKEGLYDNALVIYTSDHGDFMGHHHLVLKGNYCYDPVVRVPLVVKYPGGARAGVGVDKLVSIIDITATILDEADCNIPHTLWGLIEPLDDANREVVFAEDDQHNYMARTRSQKLLLCAQAQSQFFNLEQDPYELANLIDDPRYRADITRLKDRLFRWLAFKTPPPIHLDERGPVCAGDNVRGFATEDAQQEKDWFRAKMTE